MATTKTAIQKTDPKEPEVIPETQADTAYDIVDNRGIIDLEFLRKQDQGAASVISAGIKKIDELDEIKKCIGLAINKVYAEIRVQTGVRRDSITLVRKLNAMETESRTTFLQDVALVSQVAQLELPLALSKHGPEKSVTAKLKGGKKTTEQSEEDAVTGAALED